MSEKNPHAGSTLESFLREEGIYEEVSAEAKRKLQEGFISYFLNGIGWAHINGKVFEIPSGRVTEE